MKALKEIGIHKAFKFGLLTPALMIYQALPFPQMRNPFLRLLGAKIGGNTIIHPVQFFNYYRRGFPGLSIGDDCFIGDGCLIDLAEAVELQDNVTLAERVTVLTHRNVGYASHPLQEKFPPEAKPVRFCSGCFIGACATILPGVSIGERAFVAAGAVVTEDVPPAVVAGGVPARKIKDIFE